MEEIFAIVDEEGNRIGKASRSECHSGSKILHPVVHLHIFNSRGELYMQKRSMSKDVFPGKWDTSSAGHIDLDELPHTAVKREVYEELGISEITPVFITKYVIETTTERELSYCYYVVYDGAISIDHNEVDEGRFWTLDEIEKHMFKGIFTYNFEKDFVNFVRTLFLKFK